MMINGFSVQGEGWSDFLYKRKTETERERKCGRKRSLGSLLGKVSLNKKTFLDTFLTLKVTFFVITVANF